MVSGGADRSKCPFDYESFPGAIFIAPGSNGAIEITLTQNSLVGGIDLPGSSETGDQFGAATAWGDIDGDGYADLAVAAPGEDDTSGHADGITLLYGSATRLTASSTMYFAPASARVGGDQCGAALTVGDYNADGKIDVLAFCCGSYAMWVVDGATCTVKDTAPQELTGTVSQPLRAGSWRDRADQPAGEATVGLTGVATLTIEGHDQGAPEYPKVALGRPVLHGF